MGDCGGQTDQQMAWTHTPAPGSERPDPQVFLTWEGNGHLCLQVPACPSYLPVGVKRHHDGGGGI